MTQDFAKNTRKPSAGRKTSSTTQKSKTGKKRNNTRRKTENNKAPLWAWIIIGLLLAALITLLIYLANREHSEQVAQPKKQTETKKPASQPRFDFYQILKEQEIEVEDRSAEIKSAVPDNLLYYLQASSFRSAEDAERLKAELLLENLPAAIENNTNDQGTTWHRVIVGPFKSRSKMAKAQSKLASKKLKPLLLKRTIE